jgi:hypothetical protein
MSGWEKGTIGYDVGATRLGRAVVGWWRSRHSLALVVLVVDSSLLTPRPYLAHATPFLPRERANRAGPHALPNPRGSRVGDT